MIKNVINNTNNNNNNNILTTIISRVFSSCDKHVPLVTWRVCYELPQRHLVGLTSYCKKIHVENINGTPPPHQKNPQKTKKQACS